MTNGIVLGRSLRCRKTPTTTGSIWGRFSNGTVMNVINSPDAGWYQTTWNGSVGYIMKSFVAVASDIVKVNATNVNVRDKPSISGTTVLYRLSSPTTATVVSVISDWVKIQPSGKSAGWICADYVDKSGSGTSAGGSSISSDDNPTYITGHFGHTTKPGVRLRTSPGSNSFVQVVQGSMFYIEGTETGPAITGSSSTLWVKVRFGKGDGTHKSCYIHSSCFGHTLIVTASVKTRIVAIAQTLVNNTGSSLGMSGDWCQRFIYWLCGASGMNVSGLPYCEGYCGRARLAMVNSGKGTWHQRGDGYVPSAGDLIYYGKLDSDTSRHVGIVVVGGNDFKTIEGNMGGNKNGSLNKVKLCTGSVSSEKSNGDYYQGFVKLSI